MKSYCRAAPSRRSSIGFTRGRTNELGRVIARGNPLRKSDYNTRVVCGLEKKVVTFSFFFFHLKRGALTCVVHWRQINRSFRRSAGRNRKERWPLLVRPPVMRFRFMAQMKRGTLR